MGITYIERPRRAALETARLDGRDLGRWRRLSGDSVDAPSILADAVMHAVATSHKWRLVGMNTGFLSVYDVIP